MFEDHVLLARPLAEFALGIAACRGKLADAHYLVQHVASAKTLAILRALPGVTSPSSPGWGSDVVGAANMVEGFYNSLSNTAFNQLLPAMRIVPQRVRVVASTAVAGDSPAEAGSKSIFSLELTDGMLGPHKAVCTVVVSSELAATPLAVDFISGELRTGVGLATDLSFLTAIAAGAPATPASGDDAEALRADLNDALGSLGLGAGSSPFIIMAPARALAISLMSTQGGAFAFPDMASGGGHIAGTPVVTSDALAGDTTDTILAVDAAGLAVDPGELLMTSASHAVVDLGGGGGVVSLWANNLLGVRAERQFAASVARAGAVSKITGAAYGSGGETSP